MSSVDNSIGQGGDFQKGATVTGNVYDTSPSGLGILPAYLAPGSNVSATSTTTVSGTSGAVVTTLASWPPGSPTDGEFVFLELPSTYDPVGGKKIRWSFVYNLADTVWDFVGGPPLYAEVQTQESPGSTGAYVALATAGPSVVLPRAGDYIVAVGSAQSSNGAILNAHSYDIGATGAVDGDAAQSYLNNATAALTSVSRERFKAGLSAVTLTSKYKAASVSNGFSNRWMRVTPVRIS